MQTNSSKHSQSPTGIIDFRLTAEAVVFGIALLVLVSAAFVRIGSVAISMVLIYAWLILTLLAVAIWIYRPAIGNLKRSLEGQIRRRRYVTVSIRIVLYLIPMAVIGWGEYHLFRLLLLKVR